MPACEDKDYLSNVEIQTKVRRGLVPDLEVHVRYFAKSGLAAMLRRMARLALKSVGPEGLALRSVAKPCERTWTGVRILSR